MTSTEKSDVVLTEALGIAERLSPQAAKQAASALALLRRQGGHGLETALRLDPPAGGSARHWAEFRRVVTPQLVQRVVEEHGQEGLAILLGWVKRLGVVKEAARRASPPTQTRRAR
jgi:hypothetical protein